MHKISSSKVKKKNQNALKNEIVFQHNNLVEARYRLTLQEKRLVLWLASQVSSTDEDFKEHLLSIKDFANLLEIKGDHLYPELQALTRRLMQRIITIKPIGEKRLIQVAWLGAADYKIDQGTVALSFHPHLQPFLLNLKSQFTAITLSDVMQLQSIYAVRLYELLKQYESIGERAISLQDLRGYCGINDDEYIRYNDFKRKVIEAAWREIDRKSDITFTYAEIKQSRKIAAIEFYIKKNPKYQKSAAEVAKIEGAQQRKVVKEVNRHQQLLEQIIEYGFSKQVATKMTQDLTDKEMAAALKAVDIQIENGKVRNPGALLRTAFKEKWHPKIFKTKKAD